MFLIGKTIKNLRIENEMTELDLASVLSCSVDQIKKWENDIEYPDITILPKIASIFNVSIEYLTTGKITPVNNFDELLEKVTKNDDVTKLADNLIKGIDKQNNPLIYYVIKNESLKIFDYLVKTQKLKYALNNKNINEFKDDIINLSLLSENIQNLPKMGLSDISITNDINDSFYKILVTDTRISQNTFDYILNIHKLDINTGDYLYMPNDSRHVKGLWQIIYPKILEYAIIYNNIKLMYNVYKACLDANSYAISVIKNNNITYFLSNKPLSKYDAQRKTNIPIVEIPYHLLELMLHNKMYTILKDFNNLNKQINAKYMDFNTINLEEIKDDKNATDLDILKIKYVKLELLDINKLLQNYKNPTEYEKELICNMINSYPITYIELINNYILDNNYKKVFEFAVDYEIDYLIKLVISKKDDEIIPYMMKLFGYTDILNDGHIKELKIKIKELNNDATKYAEENNSHMVNRTYEKIANKINEEKINHQINLEKINTNLNQKIYHEMLEVEFNIIPFSQLMGLKENNIKQNSDNYKIKLYNEYLKKVGA